MERQEVKGITIGSEQTGGTDDAICEDGRQRAPSPFKRKAFEEAYLRRKLRENRLPLIALALILTQERGKVAWKSLRQEIIDQLAKHPEDAVSILTMAQNIWDWAETKYTTKHVGPDHARTFTVTAALPFKTAGFGGQVQEEIVTGLGKAPTAELAKYHAAVDLLARLGGNTVPEKVAQAPSSFKEHEVVRLAVAMPDKGLVVGSTVCIAKVTPEGYEVECITVNGREFLPMPASSLMPYEAPVPVENTIEGKLKALQDKDPVSALMEYVQQMKVASPNFTFDKSGPDHIPTITCTCRMGSIVKTATSTSKQDAKKKAAKAVLEALPV